MFNFRRNERAAERRLRPKGGEPSLTLLAEGKVDRFQRCTPLQDDSPFTFGMRSLFGQVCSSQSQDGEPIRSLGVTSCNPQEGKSTIAKTLANIAAESQQVLLINASDARFNVQRTLQDHARPSLLLADPAMQQDTAEQRLDGSLDLVPSANHRTLATPGSIREFLQGLTAKFDLIIVDLPSLNGAGCLEWASALGGMLLVVESERVRWQVAARGVALLEQAGGQVLGSVINKRRDYIPECLYRRL